MKIRVPTPREDRAAPPEFAPVPRKCVRHDGWTPERQRAFVEAMADTGSVTRAAAAVNMSTESAYALRRQPNAESFRRAWESALDFGVSRLKDIALERAIEGQLVPIMAGGKLHGYRRVRNDRLLMFAIRMNDRGSDGRRHGASQFRPRDGERPAASVTMSGLSAAEAQDADAAAIAGFLPVPQDPRQQAEVYEALAAEARRRADMAPGEDLDDPLVHDAYGHGELLASPHPSEDGGTLPPGERRWYRLHDEAGLRAIDEAVAQVHAARAAQAARTEAHAAPPAPDPAAPPTPAPPAIEAPSPDLPAPPDALTPAPLAPAAPLTLAAKISAKTGKPVRPYKKRTPKPRFDPIDWRNYKE